MARYRYRPARYYNDFEWRPYVSVAARGFEAARQLLELKKSGHVVSPVRVEGRAMAKTFWGKAWCDNLERYSDFANRLPRGRTYVRSGSVVDLQIAPGLVTALVRGTELYTVEARIAVVPKKDWSAICADCAGAIDSLVELLQGRLSTAVMERLCRDRTGLFPTPKEIAFSCSCPDWASMCKHVAAVLYGIGARLDAQPDLLFTLRKVDAQDLIAQAGTSLPRSSGKPGAAKVLDTGDLGEMFGIDIAPAEAPASRPARPARVARKAPAKKAHLRASARAGASGTRARAATSNTTTTTKKKKGKKTSKRKSKNSS